MCTSLTQAFRQHRRRPGRAAAIVAILSLCIGSCVAIFGMVKAVLFTDWSYADAGRIAVIWHARPNLPGTIAMGPSDVVSYQSSLTTFERVAGVTTRGFNLGHGTSPSRVTCARMTAEMFPLLGVEPRQGRWFTAEDDRTAAPVVAVSHRMWMAALDGDPSAIGREIVLDAMPRRIVAIMPERFVFPPEGVQGLAPADCWIPASYSPAELAIPSFSHVTIGRLARDASWEQAGADAHHGAQRIWATYPAAVQSQVQLTARVVPLIEQSTARAWTPLALFAGSVISLLLIGCANTSNLMLTSFDGRREEIAVRMSLGASRASIMAQVLLESLGLALAGGLFGAAIARGLLAAMIAANAAAFPRLAEARVDFYALAFAMLCAIVAGLLGGFAPARAASDQQGLHQERARATARGFAGTAWRRGLIGFELAMAVMVLIMAGVLARSVQNLNAVEMGIADHGVIGFSVALPDLTYQRPDRVAAFRDGVLERLEHLPGVTAAAASSAPPIGETIPGVVRPAGSVSPADFRPAAVYSVTEKFAETIGMTVKAGRLFEEADRARERVAVLNESLARLIAPDGNIVGRSVTLVGQSQPMTVVGVVGDVRQAGPLRPPVPAIYRLLPQVEQPIRTLHFVMRSGVALTPLGDQLRQAVAGVDAGIPLFGLRTIADSIAATTAVQRFNMFVVGVFAAFAMLLAVTGLYAVLAHSVQQARREFGVRLALGATPRRIVRTVLAQAMWPAAIGIAGGAMAALSATELMTSLLFGVKPNDLPTIGGVIAVVLLASAASVLRPAMRAARVDPATLLRSE